MSADKRFIITSRLNKAKHDVMTYGEYNTINEVYELQRQGYTIIQIADDIGLVYVIGEVP